MSKPSATAIVIGGGVIGLSTAYQLAQKGFGQIILLEKEQIGDGASSRAGGIITGLLWTETGVAARKIALRLYDELSAELGDYGYRFQRVGCLNLFDSGSWHEREPLLSLYDKQQVAYEVMEPGSMMKRWPELKMGDDLIGLFDPLGGYSEPGDYLQALTQRCRDLGVEIREGVQANGLAQSGGRATGVLTSAGLIEADVVISTVHVWSLKLLETISWQLPIKSFVHQRYITHPFSTAIDLPAINANPYGGYLRPASGNRVLVGGETEDRSEFRLPNAAYRMTGLTAPKAYSNQLQKTITPLLPRLGGSSWEEEKIGLLSFSMDGEPILGAVPHIAEFYVGCAFHSGGFAYNPVAGLLLAELVADGQTTINIDAFSPGRFNDEVTKEHLAQTLAQRDAIQRRH